MKAASAAASAPTPNHSNTKPDVKISATTSIAPRINHKTQYHSLICLRVFESLVPLCGRGLAFCQVLQHEPDIRRSLSQPAHEVRIPVFPVRDIDSHVESVAGQLPLQITPDTVKHLKLELLFPNSLAGREFHRGIDHFWIV